MQRYEKINAIAGCLLLGVFCGTGVFAEEHTTKALPSIFEETHTAPDVKDCPLRIVVEANVKGGIADGVLLAHGGNVTGYVIHIEEGIPVFEVSQKKEIFRVAWPQAVKGRMRIVAELNTEKMSLSVNGEPVARLVNQFGIVAPKGPPGSVLFFHPDCVHGSSTNMSPFGRNIVVINFNSTENLPVVPDNPRPEFLASRDYRPIVPQQ